MNIFSRFIHWLTPPQTIAPPSSFATSPLRPIRSSRYDNKIFLQERNTSTPLELSHKEFSEKTGITYSKRLSFYDSRTEALVKKRSANAYKYNLVGPEILWNASFYSQELERCHVAPVTIKWVDPEVGYGLFARESLAPHTLIGEYTGIIKKKRYLINLNITPYSFSYPTSLSHYRSFIIDAEKCGNETRYINHSDTPNCIAIAAYYGGLFHILVVAQCVIEEGEQLFYGYGDDYWINRGTPRSWSS